MTDFEDRLRDHLAAEAGGVTGMPRNLWVRVVEGSGPGRGAWLWAAPAAAALVFVVALALVLTGGRKPPAPAGPSGGSHPSATAPVAPSARPGAPASPATQGFTCAGPASGGSQSATGNLAAVRVAHQAGYDRVVFEFVGDGIPVYAITRQASARFTQDPSGRDVQLQGTAGLKLVMHGASTRDAGGTQTYGGPVDIVLPPPGSIAEVRELGDFERVLSWGIGVTRNPACLRADQLASPARLVVDVQGG